MAAVDETSLSGEKVWNFTASAPDGRRDVDEPVGEVEVAVVVHARLGDDVDVTRRRDLAPAMVAVRHGCTPSPRGLRILGVGAGHADDRAGRRGRSR